MSSQRCLLPTTPLIPAPIESSSSSPWRPKEILPDHPAPTPPGNQRPGPLRVQKRLPHAFCARLSGNVGGIHHVRRRAKLMGQCAHRKGRLRQERGPRALCGALVASALVGLLLPHASAQKANSDATSVVVQPGAPGQPSRTLPPSTHPTVPRVSQADVAFMQGMIMHHSRRWR
jgi:hypothetical protein